MSGELGELEAFDEAVGRVSGGRLRIKWHNEYGKGRDGNAEVNLIRDVSAGKADLGWAGTRVFDELGEPAFNPLHAPMFVDSYELEEKVLSDPLVDPMLESLGDLGFGASESCRARCAGRSAAVRCAALATGPAPASARAAALNSRRRCARSERESPTTIPRGARPREPRRDRDARRGRARQPLPLRLPLPHRQRRVVGAPLRALRGARRERG